MKSSHIDVACGCFAERETVANIPDMIRILAVDDHPLLRKGIASLVNGEPDMKLVAEACNGEEAVESFRVHRPDVTLMDLQLPGLNGIEAIDRYPERISCGTHCRLYDLYGRRAGGAGASRWGAGVHIKRTCASRTPGNDPHGTCRAKKNSAGYCHGTGRACDR